MRIHRSRPEKSFTQISNEVLRDTRLSYMARGVLFELLSRPDGWDVNADSLARQAQEQRARNGEGRRPMRAVFAELTAAGYLVHTHSRGADGRIISELHLFGVPQTGSHPDGMPVPPGQTDESAGDTGVPLTGSHPGGTSNRTLSTNTEEHGRNDLASRHGRAKRASTRATTDEAVSYVKRAVALVHGPGRANSLSDEELLGLWIRFVGSRIPDEPVAYLAKILRDAPELETYLEKSRPWCHWCQNWEDECTCPAA